MVLLLLELCGSIDRFTYSWLAIFGDQDETLRVPFVCFEVSPLQATGFARCPSAMMGGSDGFPVDWVLWKNHEDQEDGVESFVGRDELQRGFCRYCVAGKEVARGGYPLSYQGKPGCYGSLHSRYHHAYHQCKLLLHIYIITCSVYIDRVAFVSRWRIYRHWMFRLPTFTKQNSIFYFFKFKELRYVPASIHIRN